MEDVKNTPKTRGGQGKENIKASSIENHTKQIVTDKANNENLKFTVMNFNIQSVAAKVDVLNNFLKTTEITVIGLTEHFLTKDKLENLHINNFAIGSAYCRENSRGGSMILLSENFEYIERTDLMNLSIEAQIEISAVEIKAYNMIIITIYSPPSSNYETLIDIMEAMVNMVDLDMNIVVMGDFNINFLENSKQKQTLLDTLRVCNVFPLFSEPSKVCHANCIDNIFADSTRLQCATETINLHISDHLAQISTFIMSLTKKSANTVNRKKIRIYRPENILEFVNSLRSDEFLTRSRWSFEAFHDMFITAFNNSFPEKLVKLHSNKTIAANQNLELTKMKQSLDALATIVTTTKDKESYEVYRQKKKEYLDKHTQLRKQENAKYIECADNRNRAVWEVISKETKRTKPVNEDSTISANEFNEYFHKIGEHIATNIHSNISAIEYLENRQINNVKSFLFAPLTQEEIINIVRQMKSKKSKDIYGMSTDLLKQVIDIIAEPLTYVLNACIQKGSFPKELKVARVVPIYKKGDKNECSSYRPISVLPIISKVFEYAIASRIINFMERNGYLCEQQHGFRKERSTESGILSVVEYICSAYDDGMCVEMNMMDLSKAFDSIDRSTLMQKLQYYGIRGTPFSLLESYLSDRFQVVEWQNRRSELRQTKYGVPQGSILGPLLFVILMNDITYSINDKNIMMCLYADDTTLLMRSRSENELRALTGNAMDDVMKWFSANKMQANPQKTQSLAFKTKPNKDQQEAKFLGIYLDSFLKWDRHVEYLAKTLSSAIFAMRRIKSVATPHAARMAYFSMFHSKMTYGILFWGLSTEAERIFKLQKLAIRLLSNLQYRESCRGWFKRENILTMASQYILTSVKFVHSHLPNYTCNGDSHHYRTRHRQDLSVPYHRLSATQKYLDYWGPKLYNVLPVELKSRSSKAFAKGVRQLLITQECYNLEEYLRCNK